MRKDLYKSSSSRRFVPIFVTLMVGAVLFFVAIQFHIVDSIGVPTATLAEPALKGKGSVLETFSRLSGFVRVKSSLVVENQQLKHLLAEEEGKDVLIRALLREIGELREFEVPLFEKGVRASVLAKPPTTVYDTIILDVGEDRGIKKGDLVLSPSGIALGRIEGVYTSLSRARLFSSVGQTEKIMLGGNETVEARGAGGGMFFAIVPKELNVEVGSIVALEGERRLVVGTIDAVGSDSAGSLKTLVIRAGANMNNLGFVEIIPALVLPLETN